MSQLQFLVRQFVGAFAYSGRSPDEFQRADEIISNLGDHLSSAAWDAFKKIRAANPVAAAEFISRSGHPAVSVEDIDREMLSLATRWTDDGKPISPDSVYRQMAESHDQVRGEKKFEQVFQNLKLHRITVLEAAQQVQEIAADGMDRPDAFADSSDWGSHAVEYIQQRKHLEQNNLILSWPNEFPTLQARVPEMEPGILAALIAQSGVGKSMFLAQIVDHWALFHKHAVLNCSTELTSATLLWRRVSRRTQIPVARLKRGDLRIYKRRLSNGKEEEVNEPQIVKEAFALYRQGGWIRDYECPGKTPDDLIRHALHIKGHIALDYFDMLDLNRSKMIGRYTDSNKTDAVGYALTAFKDYATSENKVVWIVLQTGKEAAPKIVDGKIVGQQSLKLENGMDSVRFRHRTNFGIAMNFKVVEHPQIVQAPKSKQNLEERPGSFSCMGYGQVVKDTFSGQEGTKFRLFRDGPISTLYEYAQEIIPISQLPAWQANRPENMVVMAAPEEDGKRVSRAVPERYEDVRGQDGGDPPEL